MPAPPLLRGLRINVDDHLGLRLPLSVGEVHLLPHQTGEHWTLMVIPPQARQQAISTIARATGGVRRRNGWLLQNWTCRSLSRPTQVQK